MTTNTINSKTEDKIEKTAEKPSDVVAASKIGNDPISQTGSFKSASTINADNSIEAQKEKSKTSGITGLSGTESDGKAEVGFINDSLTKGNDFVFPSEKEETVKTKGSKKKIIPLLLLLLVLIGGTLFLYLKGSSESVISPIPQVGEGNDNGAVKKNAEFENPLNGSYFTNEEAAKFKDNKPVAVMVNNYELARPSAGLSYADVVYEVLAESGITRIMPIFYSRIPEKVSSVRSARYYFAQLAAGYKAEYFHWGAAHVPPCQKAAVGSASYCPPVGGKVETNPEVDAYDWIVKLGLANLDGGNYSCDADNCAFGRDPEKLNKVPLEHTAFVRVPLALELARKIRPDESWHKYIPVTEWKFKDDASVESRGSIGLSTPINYNYADIPAFEVKWVYNKDSNDYTRYQGGVKQIDAINNEDLKAKTIIIRFTTVVSAGDKKAHLMHQIEGTGDALIFQDGNVIKAKWTNTNIEERDLYTDMEGNVVELNRGQIWVQVVPMEIKVNYEEKTETTAPSPVSSVPAQ